jgi:hypothetical protein
MTYNFPNSPSIGDITSDNTWMWNGTAWLPNQFETIFGGTVVNVKTYGAEGDFDFTTETGTDDTVAFIAAITAAGERGVVYIPPGSYRITSTISISKFISFIGASNSSSMLVFEDCDGFIFDLSSANVNNMVTFSNLALLTTVQDTRTAVQYTGLNDSGPMPNETQFLYCVFIGADKIKNAAWTGKAEEGYLGWKHAINLQDSDGSLIDGCFIRGNQYSAASNFAVETVAIQANNATLVYINNTNIYRYDTGMLFTGQGEGTRISNCVLVACREGVRFENLVSPANNHTIIGSHFHCNETCINMLENEDFTGWNSIIGNFFLKRIELTGSYYIDEGYAGYKAINLEAKRSSIIGNTFTTNPMYDFVALGDTGIFVNGDNNTIQGNVFHNSGTCIYINTGANYNTVIGNVGSIQVDGSFVDLPLVLVENAGAGTTIIGNKEQYAGRDTVYSSGGEHNFVTSTGDITVQLTNVADQVCYLSIYGDVVADPKINIEARSTDVSDVDVLLNPLGTGKVRFGTHSASSDVAISGYITIKDEAGTTRKLAVIS